MKKIFFFCYLFLANSLSAQVGINTETPNARLDIRSSSQTSPAATDGILIPRIDVFPSTNPGAAQNGMLVFLTTDRTFYYWNHAQGAWIALTDDLVAIKCIDDLTDGLSDCDGSNDGSSIYLGVGAGHLDDHSDNRNNALGYQTLMANTSGEMNTAMGYQALLNNTTGSNNTAIGNAALRSNTDRSGLVAIGFEALFSNGINASQSNHGQFNTAVGTATLRNNTTGYSNTALGYQALNGNESGTRNTAAGNRSLFNNTTGSYNLANGWQSLNSNTEGEYNTANGVQSLFSNTTGSHNVAIGATALYSNTTPSGLVAVGDSALYNNGSNAFVEEYGRYNTAVGLGALKGNANEFKNTAVGYHANYISGGIENVAIGYNAMRDHYLGEQNVACGNAAMQKSGEANHNTAIGYQALYKAASNNNTALGYLTLKELSGGINNLAAGHRAMESTTNASNNTAIGTFALLSNHTGENNTALGSQTLSNILAGSNNTAVGAYSGQNLTDYQNSTSIGYLTTAQGTNQVAIGNTSVTWIGGMVNWSTYSDALVKQDVEENVRGLDFITRLRPVTYRFDKDKIDELTGTKDPSEYPEKYDCEKVRRSGFIAQEVEQAALASGYDFSGLHPPHGDAKYYSLSYAEFVVPLVKAIQEQQALIGELQARIEVLELELGK
jgi:hypothetical protein